MTEKSTVHYVTQDLIQNLKLKITLTRLSAVRSKTRIEPVANENATPNTDAAGQPQPANAPAPLVNIQNETFTRVFSWQEKVFSKAEVIAYKAQLADSGQSARANALQSHKQVPAEGFEGSILFSYTQADPHVDEAELRKTVTTAQDELNNPLVKTLLNNSRNRQRMMKSYVMYIMADLGDEHSVAGSQEVELVVIKAHPDGSFDMKPGFSPTLSGPKSGMAATYRYARAGAAVPMRCLCCGERICALRRWVEIQVAGRRRGMGSR